MVWFRPLVEALDVLIKITLLIKHFVTDLTSMALTFMEIPNMMVPITSSRKTFPTQTTHRDVTLPFLHLVRLDLYGIYHILLVGPV